MARDRLQASKPNPQHHHSPSSADHHDFWASPAGRSLLSWEQTVLDRLAQQVFGFHALSFEQNGLHALRTSAVHQQLIVHTHLPTLEANEVILKIASTKTTINTAMMMDSSDWPVQNDSLDYIVLPHVLEFATDPHAVLREAARCLRPGAYLTVISFNPRSLLGLQSSGAGLGASRHWLSRRRLIDWMKLLGLQVDQGAVGQWRPLLDSEKRYQQMAWLDTVGERWWPHMANVYALRVVKRALPDVRQFKPKARGAFAQGARAASVARSTKPVAQASRTEPVSAVVHEFRDVNGGHD